MAGVSPLIVMLPGMDGSGLLFAPLQAHLGESQVIALPQSGGQDLATLLPIVRAALPQTRPFVLLAESFSGPLAIALAHSAPPHLCGLILCCSFASCPFPPLPLLKQLVPLLPLKHLPLRLTSPFLLGFKQNAQIRQKLAQALAQVPASTLRQRLNTLTHIDLTHELEQLQLPLLYLHAQNDWLLGQRALRKLLHHQSNAELAQLPGPHLLLQTRPSAAATVIVNFVTRLDLVSLR